jgi:hypothetical protein
MKKSSAIMAGLLALAGLLGAVASRGQESASVPTTQVIDVYRGAPIKHAVDILRQRYHLAISYEDPVYACACDLSQTTRRSSGPTLVYPRPRRLHFEYVEINGKPQEDITSLIHRLLAQYAAQGEEVFDVRAQDTPNGTSWNGFR